MEVGKGSWAEKLSCRSSGPNFTKTLRRWFYKKQSADLRRDDRKDRFHLASLEILIGRRASIHPLWTGDDAWKSNYETLTVSWMKMNTGGLQERPKMMRGKSIRHHHCIHNHLLKKWGKLFLAVNFNRSFNCYKYLQRYLKSAIHIFSMHSNIHTYYIITYNYIHAFIQIYSLWTGDTYIHTHTRAYIQELQLA